MRSSSGRPFVHAVFYGMFFMHLCEQSSRRKVVLNAEWKDVLNIKHILPPARLLTYMREKHTIKSCMYKWSS